MKTEEKIREILKSYDTQPIYLWGPLGTDKLHLLERVAKEEGTDFINLTPVGSPELMAGGIKKLFPCLPSTEARGILVIDLVEIRARVNCREIFLPLIPLILYGRKGNYNLPAGWQIILVSNEPLERFFTEFLEVPPGPLLRLLDHCMVID